VSEAIADAGSTFYRHKPHIVMLRDGEVRTYPRLGGSRLWFVDQRQRGGRLHLPPGSDRFRCRRAHRLVCRSQYETQIQRGQRRIGKIMGYLG
jgi:hypothetical protein